MRQIRSRKTSFYYVVIVIWLGVMIPFIIHAHPQSFNCDGPKWKPNLPFGHMLVDRLSAVHHENECRIEGVPKRFHPGRRYPIKVYSEAALGHKLNVDQGRLIADRAKAFESESKLQTSTCGYRYKQKMSAYIWVAPTQTKSVGFYAMCGQFIGPIYVAQPIVSTLRLSSDPADEEFLNDENEQSISNDDEHAGERGAAAIYL